MRVKRHWTAVVGLMALSAAAQADQSRDMVIGNGTPGPYALSWKAVAAGTDSVQVNAVSQTRNLDYTFDPNAGTITFSRPLPAQSAAEVDYEYDPGHAVRTGADLAIPLSLDLARGEHGGLSLDALYKRPGGADSSDPGTLTVGLGGGWQGAREQLTTRLLFAPQLVSVHPGHSTDSLDRTGLTLSGSTQVSPMAKFSFGYARVGADLGQAAADNGWQSGTQTLTLGSSFAPSQKVSAFVNYSQIDPLASAHGMTAQIATGMTFSPLNSLQFQTHWTQATAGGVATDTGDMSLVAKPTATTELDASLSGRNAPGGGSDTQAMSLTAKINPNKSLSVQTQLGQTSAGQKGTTQAAAVNVNAQPTAATQVAASFALTNAPGTGSDTQAINLAAQIAPGQGVALSAGAGQIRQGDAATDRQQIALSLTPRAQVQLHTGVVLSQTDQYDTTAANFGGALQPVSFLQFSADYTSRIAPVADPLAQDNLDSSTAQVALAPMKGLRVTGHYQQNPSDSSGNPQRIAQRGLGLETTVGAVSLTGGYDWTRQYTTPNIGTTLNLGLGLRLSRALQLTGGYQQTLTGLGDTPTGACLYTFGLTHNLGDRFNLSMTGTMQQPTGTTVSATPNYTASANLGMKF